MRTTHSWIVAAIVLALTASARSAPLQTPAPPTASVVGRPGSRTVCYWVFAESAEKAAVNGEMRYNDVFAGKITDLSKPCVVINAPDKMDADNKIVLTLSPVAGAVKYHVLRTEVLAAPTLDIKVKRPGTGTLYYWIQGHNGWRNSPLAGPFKVECDPDNFANDLIVTPASPNQWKESIWVTQSPEPPIGRKFHVVTMMTPHSQDGLPKYPLTLAHSSRNIAGWGQGFFETTPPQEKPTGTGKFLLASTAGLMVEDTGKELGWIKSAPTANETLEQTGFDRVNHEQSSRYTFKGLTLSPTFTGQMCAENDFYGLYCPFSLEVNVPQGGKYYYQNPPIWDGYKSTAIGSRTILTTRALGQCAVQQNVLNAYAAGDCVNEDVNMNLYGGNREGGDEGGSLLRTFITRNLAESTGTLTRDAKVGTFLLAYKGETGYTGAGRIVVNLSQARNTGRIDHVVNCDVCGDGTDWQKSDEGSFISFDVDNVIAYNKAKRTWFVIVKVLGAEHIQVLMHTAWRSDINLGYSRFIYNPAKGQTLPNLKDIGITYGGPEVYNPDMASFHQADKEHTEAVKSEKLLYSNPLAIGVLPQDKEAAAAAGAYLMAPGAYLDDPWQENGMLRVEGLQQDWKSGDKICLTIGTSQGMTISWGWLTGDLGPNDYVNGYCVQSEFNNRPANGIAFSATNIGIGMRVNLPANKQGNGVIVVGEPVDAAYIAAPDVPMLRCYHSQIPFVQGSRDRTALEVVAPTGERPLSVSKDSVTVDGAVSITGAIVGSAQTRGEAALSGDGVRKVFEVTFAKAFGARPVVLISSNQFARSRLASVTPTGFTVEFEEAPKAGKDNITIWWMAQE